MRTIELPVSNIVVTLENGGGSITSDMREDCDTVDSDEAWDFIQSFA